MPPVRPAPGLAVLCVSVVLFGANGAQAAAPQAKPLEAAECDRLAKAIGQAAGLAMTASVADLESPDAEGKACRLSAETKGASVAAFAKAEKGLKGWLSKAGWKVEPDAMTRRQAGEVAIGQYGQGQRHVAYDLVATPPEDACKDTPISACKAPRSRWTLTLTLQAFALAAN